jgi:hypothetical protein
MLRRFITTLIIGLLMLLVNGGLVFALKPTPADPGFIFVDVNRDGLYHPEDGDKPAVIDAETTVYGKFVTVQLPVEISWESDADLVIPPSIKPINAGIPGEKRYSSVTIYGSATGTIKMGKNVKVSAEDIYIQGYRVELGKGVNIIAGYLMIEAEQGGVWMDSKVFIKSRDYCTIYASAWGSRQGSIEANNVYIETWELTLGAEMNISLTNSQIVLKGSSPTAYIMTDYAYVSTPSPVDLTKTMFAGKGYHLQVYGKPITKDGMRLTGSCAGFYVDP